MKRKTAIICAVSAGFLVMALFVIHDVQAYSHGFHILRDVKYLGMLAEGFKQDHGTYPPSLQLLEAEAPPETRKDLAEILHQHFGDRYVYRPLPAGFTITVDRKSTRL